jgi:hypothetical protein
LDPIAAFTGIGSMKEAYVQLMRAARGVADALGLLKVLEHSSHKKVRWVRSLFSIYDSKDLIHLDLPWWTYDAIDAVEAHLASFGGDARVFEYGAGASTVWLAKRSRSVHSVEHDLVFAQSMEAVFATYANITLDIVPPERDSDVRGSVRSQRKGYAQCSFDAYARAIDQAAGGFDLIIIDGRARNACLAQALGRLSERGVLLFDNSDREEYRGAIGACGLEERRLRGLAPALPLPSQTSLLLARRA